jgi:hypothetical protein
MTSTFTVQRLIKTIRALPPDRPRIRPGIWYKTQKQHWLGWLREYHGPGAYGRVPGQPRRDARFVYNHIVNPQMLLWLISSAGVGRASVSSARRAARNAGALNQQAAAIRRHVPWEILMAALIRRERSRRLPRRAA